jgi:hypothetical protein
MDGGWREMELLFLPHSEERLVRLRRKTETDERE